MDVLRIMWRVFLFLIFWLVICFVGLFFLKVVGWFNISEILLLILVVLIKKEFLILLWWLDLLVIFVGLFKVCWWILFVMWVMWIVVKFEFIYCFGIEWLLCVVEFNKVNCYLLLMLWFEFWILKESSYFIVLGF